MSAQTAAPVAKPIRWGILSTGNISTNFTHALLHVSQHITAVCSRSADTAQKFIETHLSKQGKAKSGEPGKVVQVHTSCESLAKDPHVDVVYVGSPHAFHYQHVMTCLHGGKHVLCEKSFCINANQAEKMIALAREKGLFLMEAMWTRCMPPIRQKLQELLRSGAIGQIVAMKGNLSFFGNAKDTEHRLFKKELAGGALLDVGIYVLSMASLVMEARHPTRIQSDMTFLPSTKVDEQCAMLLAWEGNAKDGNDQTVLATLHCAVTSKLAQRTFTITGTKGYINLEDPFHRTSRITVCRVDDEVTVENPSSGTGNARRKEHMEVLDFPEMQDLGYVGSGLHFEALHVAECLQQGKTESDLMPLDETLMLMRIMDTIRKQNNFRYPDNLEQA